MPLCLRCVPERLLVPSSGALGEAACPGCGGRLLDEPITSSLFIEQLGLTRDQLIGGAPTHERCPACEALRLAFIEVEGTPATVCTACGAAWLDAGALSALTHGVVAEVRPVARPEAVSVVSRVVVDGNALAELFERAAFRTAADARLIGAGHGLIVERAPRIEAERLVAVLHAAGIDAEIVDAVDMAMPATSTLVGLTLEETHLVALDQRRERMEIAYDDVVTAAVGIVRVLKAERGPARRTTSLASIVGSTLGRSIKHTSHELVIARSEGPVVDIVCAGTRLRATTSSLRLSRAEGVTQETAFRDVARDLFLRLPARALTTSARALAASPLTRLEHHAPREWESMVTWERWRSLTSS